MGSLAQENLTPKDDTFEKCNANGETILKNNFISKDKISVKEGARERVETNRDTAKMKPECETNGVTPTTQPRFLSQRKKQRGYCKLVGLAGLLWFVAECVASYAILIGVVVALSPLLITYNILKVLELFVASVTRGARPICGQDALWQQDSVNNRLIITSIMIAPAPENLDKKIEEFRQVVMERMVHAKNETGELCYPRVRWCVRPGYFQYFFEDEKNFRIEKHVFLWEGSVPTSKSELEDAVSKLSGEAISRDISPWYFCVIPTNYGSNDITVVFRAHHTMADGVSLVKFLTGKLPDNVVPQKQPRKFSSKGRALMCAKALFIMGRVLIKQLLLLGDKSVLHGPKLSGVKKVAWSNATDLELIKQIKTATGTTVNDVLMACLSNAIRGYYIRMGVQNPQDFVACVPVDVRPPKKDMTFENRFAVVFLSLPSSVDGALQQLVETKKRMDAIKTSGEPISMAWLMQLSVAFCPETIVKPILGYITDKSSCVLSNVPGPQTPIVVAGEEMTKMSFWPPQRNHVGIGLSILTYGNNVYVGALSDVALMTDPGVLLEEYSSAVKELSKVVLTPRKMNGTK